MQKFPDRFLVVSSNIRAAFTVSLCVKLNVCVLFDGDQRLRRSISGRILKSAGCDGYLWRSHSTMFIVFPAGWDCPNLSTDRWFGSMEMNIQLLLILHLNRRTRAFSRTILQLISSENKKTSFSYFLLDQSGDSLSHKIYTILFPFSVQRSKVNFTT